VIGENGVTEADVLVHDETNPTIAHLLLSLCAPLPTAMGVIHRLERPAFEQSFWQHKPTERRAKVLDLLRHGNMLDRRPA
jgi:2-oxoglutarate ferredoxin oxidoreductase subunit beta